MTVVDVDTHWETAVFAPGTHPLEPWLDWLPDSVGVSPMGSQATCSALSLSSGAPTGGTMLPTLVKLAEQRGGPIILHPQHDSTSAERVAWMDGVGIDHCLVNPGGYWQMLEMLGPDRLAGVKRCNDYLAEQLAGHADRLHGVAVVDFADLQAGAAELERARPVATGPSSCTR
jgi:predicted TIM-barrel fold metal-dependent hydrolase